MEKIITTIEKIINCYCKLTKDFKIINEYKVNLSKNRVKNIYTKDIIKYIMFYHNYLCDKIDFLEGYNVGVNKYRIKNINSIIDKIDRYINSDLRGNQEISKSLNDILGFRLYIDDSYDYYYLQKELMIFYRNNVNIKNIIVSKKGDYLAVHIYFKLDNYNFPCELQLWRIKDVEKNELSHKKYKQEYTKNESIEGGGF